MGSKFRFDSKLRRKISNLIAIFGLALFVFFVFKFGHRFYHLNHYGRYTQGKVESIYEDWRYDKKIIYTFKVNGKSYSGSAWFDDKVKPKIGESYTVKYSSKKPEISQLLLRENQ